MNSAIPPGNPEQLFFDHAVLVVPGLEEATRHFTRLGFSVTPGGVHTGGLTHNALIPFKDGSYIELLAAYRRRKLPLLRLLKKINRLEASPHGKTPLARRFIDSLLMGAGINDFALGAGNLESLLAGIRDRRLDLDGPTHGGRTRPDGQQVAWRTACPTSRDLPFLIDDLTPRGLRVPDGEAAQHANRISGFAGITVMVPDLDESCARYQLLLGEPAEKLSPTADTGSSICWYSLQTSTVLLEAHSNQPKWSSACPKTLYLRTSGEPSGFLALSASAGNDFKLSEVPQDRFPPGL